MTEAMTLCRPCPFCALLRCMMDSTVRRGTSSRPGFLLLEGIIGIAVFALFLTAVGLVLLHGQESTIIGGDRVRGVFLTEEALEASRAIRDNSFLSLIAGSHGIELNETQNWMFSGIQSPRSGGYVISETITQLASDWVRISAQTKWKHGYNRSGSVLLTTELTDWRTAKYAGDWSSIVLDGSYIDSGTPLFNSVAVAGNYAYVTGDASSGGAGLYVFDLSDTTLPTRVATSFDLGTSGYGIAAKGKTLYVITGDANQEIRVYDISSPTTLSAGNLLTSFNLSGSSLATSLSLHGNILLVGAQQDPSWREFYSFDVSNSGAIMPIQSVETSAAVNAIALSGTSALLATSDPVAEMKQVHVSATGALSLLATGDYNLTDRAGGSLSTALTGTSAILGSQKGGIQEMVLFTTANGGGTFPPSVASYHEGSGSLVGVDQDPAKCYGFLAAASGRKALQVVDLRDPSLTELTTYTSVSGIARGLSYDAVRDRVYLLTRTGFLIFKPSSSIGLCS